MIVKVLIPAIVIVVMIIVGSGLQSHQFRAIAQYPVPLLGGTILQMIALPLGALSIIFLLNPSVELAAGLLLVSVCPAGALSNYYCHLGKLNVALSVMMTAVSSLLAFITLPVILSFLFPLVVSTQEAEIPVFELIHNLFAMLLLPIGFGMLIRRFFAAWVERYAQLMRVFGLVLVLLLLGLIVFDQWEGAKRIFLDAAVLATLFTLFAVLSGWAIAFFLGQKKDDRYVFSVEFSVRNIGIAAVVAATTLGRPEFVIFGALFVVFQFPLIMLLLLGPRT
jgi:BASS family bile acid:Na+ symporter